MAKRKKSSPSRKTKGFRRTPIAEISPEEQIIGAPFVSKVRDFASGWGTLVLETPLSVGDSIRVKGAQTDLTQPVERLTVGRRAVQSATEGERVRVAFADAVNPGDAVYKL